MFDLFCLGVVPWSSSSCAPRVCFYTVSEFPDGVDGKPEFISPALSGITLYKYRLSRNKRYNLWYNFIECTEWHHSTTVCCVCVWVWGVGSVFQMVAKHVKLTERRHRMQFSGLLFHGLLVSYNSFSYSKPPVSDQRIICSGIAQVNIPKDNRGFFSRIKNEYVKKIFIIFSICFSNLIII